MIKWTPHPLLPVPTDEEISSWSPQQLVRYHSVREEAIANADKDKFRYGFKFPNWEKVIEQLETHNEALISGGNRSSKTQFGAYLTVKAAIENPGSEIFCFAQNQEVSIRQQQAAVYDWLPSEYKTKQTGSSTYISFTMKNGFTDNSLILPNKSRISFKTYSQYANNPSILEGAELGSQTPTVVNLGVWLDEMLGGPEMVETLRFRLATRNSKMILTFTPIFGYTELVRQYVEGAKVIESRDAELLGGEKLATVMECRDINGTVHYFWSQDNPFGGYERIKEDLKHKSRDHILVRAYGVATKSSTTRFPKFNKAVNVIHPEMVPQDGITRYCIIDPAGSKNWFICWIAVDESGTWYVYREWPDVGVGDWVERKGDKIVPGPGAKGLGYGIKDYIELIKELEGDEEIFERIIDPRLGAAKYQSADGASSIIEDLEEHGMVCLPAPGIDIEDGLQAIISKMAYDSDKELDSVNRPHFYVTEDCENIIGGLGEYTGEEGLKEAWKDVIDVLRYAAVSDIDHVDKTKMGATSRTSGGY